MTNDYRPHNQMDYCDNPNCIYHQKPACRHGYQYPLGWITYPYVTWSISDLQNIFTKNPGYSHNEPISKDLCQYLTNIDPGDEHKE